VTARNKAIRDRIADASLVELKRLIDEGVLPGIKR
jgi:hypothetical protein